MYDARGDSSNATTGATSPHQIHLDPLSHVARGLLRSLTAPALRALRDHIWWTILR